MEGDVLRTQTEDDESHLDCSGGAIACIRRIRAKVNDAARTQSPRGRLADSSTRPADEALQRGQLFDFLGLRIVVNAAQELATPWITSGRLWAGMNGR